jgi:hypothetical protein
MLTGINGIRTSKAFELALDTGANWTKLSDLPQPLALKIRP